MTNDGHEPGWRIVGASVRGASHVRSGLPNQDAIRWLPESGDSLPLVLAVSDGHGSAKCFRSDEGSRLAVETATEIVQEFLDTLSGTLSPSAVKRWVEDNMPREIVRRWRNGVADHLSDNPLTAAELDELEAQRDAEKRRQIAMEPVFAYGATLLVVVMTDAFIFYLQLGDGDILTVAQDGQVSHAPLPEDERLFANETTSLCGRDAWREFRTHFQVISGALPALILVSSDGYANSFRDSAGFLQVGADFLDMMREDGVDAVSEGLETWLTEASQQGSGDDVTLGIICRMDALQKPEPKAEPKAKSGMPIGRVPAGHLSSVEEDKGVVVARCSQNGQDFGIRFEEQQRGHWIANWAFPHKETPGCPHCDAPSIFQCVCGKVACWDGKSQAVTCPWCDTVVQLRDQIDSLSARTDR
jgi:serine/threonine protein phosphatase PrpC